MALSGSDRRRCREAGDRSASRRWRKAGAFPIIESQPGRMPPPPSPSATGGARARRCRPRRRAAASRRGSAHGSKAGGGPFMPVLRARRRRRTPRRSDRFADWRRRAAGAADCAAALGAARARVARDRAAPRRTPSPRAAELPRRCRAPIRSTMRPCSCVGRGRSIRRSRSRSANASASIGALSVETAARYLNARDIDGIVIGDGFSPRVVEALLTALAEDARFRDLPVGVLGGAARRRRSEHCPTSIT